MKKTWIEVTIDEKSIDEKMDKAIEAREAFRKAVDELQRAASDCVKVVVKGEDD